MGRCSLDERPSNAVDVLQPLLDHQSSETEELLLPPPPKEPIIYDDTVDFGTETTSVSSAVSPSSRLSVNSFANQLPVQYIDNTQLVYIPITLACGTQVHCAPDVLSACPMVLRSIQTDVTQILKILPWSVHALVKRTPIWINRSYSYGTRDDPRVLRHSTAHHEEGWLVKCARDRPEKARGIEIYSCWDFERMRLHWNGCGLLLHEFCHMIHQFCLGLDHPAVEQSFQEAFHSGRYEKTLRRDWAGKDEDHDMAYAMVDVKEFFAELSVTYWSNGFHPLDKADKSIMEACSPPLLEPNVTDRVMQKYGLKNDGAYRTNSDDRCSFLLARKSVPRLRMVDPIWQEAAIGRGCRDVTHCNKFYPFTRGQLKHHDPKLYAAMRELWNEIAMYDDPEEGTPCCLTLVKFLPSIRR